MGFFVNLYTSLALGRSAEVAAAVRQAPMSRGAFLALDPLISELGEKRISPHPHQKPFDYYYGRARGQLALRRILEGRAEVIRPKADQPVLLNVYQQRLAEVAKGSRETFSVETARTDYQESLARMAEFFEEMGEGDLFFLAAMIRHIALLGKVEDLSFLSVVRSAQLILNQTRDQQRIEDPYWRARELYANPVDATEEDVEFLRHRLLRDEAGLEGHYVPFIGALHLVFEAGPSEAVREAAGAAFVSFSQALDVSLSSFGKAGKAAKGRGEDLERVRGYLDGALEREDYYKLKELVAYLQAAEERWSVLATHPHPRVHYELYRILSTWYPDLFNESLASLWDSEGPLIIRNLIDDSFVVRREAVRLLGFFASLGIEQALKWLRMIRADAVTSHAEEIVEIIDNVLVGPGGEHG